MVWFEIAGASVNGIPWVAVEVKDCWVFLNRSLFTFVSISIILDPTNACPGGDEAKFTS